MIRLGLKMLFGDMAKYMMLIIGVIFATFLMVQQAGVFCGLMRWTTSTLKNVPAPIWVVDPKVEQVNETIPLLDTDVARVRSVDGVAWAAPVFSGIQKVRLADGNYKITQLIGIDATTFAGAPTKMLEGRLEDLRLPNTIIIDDLAVRRLSADPKQPIGLGSVVEINDVEARVVGIADAMNSFTGGPYVWTTYERALQYAPPSRKMLSAVLAAPSPGVSTVEAARRIRERTGLSAFVNEGFSMDKNVPDFNSSTVWWYIRNTGIPFSFGITVLIGFIVGLAICSQTFTAFILENLKHLGALKAMGCSMGRLSIMVLTQAFTVGLVGYGIGLLFTAGFAAGALKNEQPPFYLPPIVPPAVLVVILLICGFSALMGIRRIARLEPAMVFRA
jgi:putative ABC transport system permease protein